MMSIVDLTKARAYADARTAGLGPDQSAEWIHKLADEVESLERELGRRRASEQAAITLVDAATKEAEILRTALTDLLGNVSELLKAATP